MRIKIKKDQAEILGLPVLRQFGIEEYEMDSKQHIINLGDHELPKIETFLKVLEAMKDKRKFSYMKRTIQTYVNIRNGKVKGQKIKNLEVFNVALIQHYKDFEGHRLYKKDTLDSDILLPYRITKIYYDTGGGYTPPHVVMRLVYKKYDRLDKREISFYADDIQNLTVDEILVKQEILDETKEIRDEYLKSIKKFNKIKKTIGKQYLVSGIGDNDTIDDRDDEEEENYRHWKTTKIFDFEEAKCVLDIFKEGDQSDKEGEREYSLGERFWADPNKAIGKYDDDSDEGESAVEIEETLEIPIHPFVVVFDLQRHLRLVVHYSYLKEYVYDENLSDKLVLPSNTKQLIQSLIEHKEGGFADIIQGKSGGVIILLSGRAGTGKTLTAEVYAESKKKALYNVQASQLGIKPKLLEHRLMKVLLRASRWDAILLVDEADVYVRERADDLVQNAIVGVFLRILEYHSTMLFMTTNRPDTVDDAILSRCIARIDYEYPSKEDQRKIWRVLADTAKIEIEDSVIEKFVEEFNEYSGRDIKNLLKLGNLKAIGDKKKLDFETLKYVTRFNPTLVQKK